MLPDSNLDLLTTETNWPVLICFLGSFRLLKYGQPIALRHTGKTSPFLLSLALAPGYCVSRETLIQTLWPESETGLAGHCLNSLTCYLHKLLAEPLKGESPILIEDGFYRIKVEAGVFLDVSLFNTFIDIGEQKERAGDQEHAETLYREAIKLYRGDLCLCPDIYAVIQREYLRARYLTALAHLADSSFSRGDYTSCLSYASQILTKDPCREDAHRLLMRCYVRLNERAQALRQYRLCEMVLRTEFNAMPEASTNDLYELIRLTPFKV